MQFFKKLFFVVLCFFIHSRATYLEQADSMVEEMTTGLNMRASSLVRPSGRKLAENITQFSSIYGMGAQDPHPLLMPHHHILSSIEFFLIEPTFSDSIVSVVASHFFPTHFVSFRGVQLTPNTVAVNDPVGKLNRANQRGEREKNEASRRLGAMARLVQDSFEGVFSPNEFTTHLLQAWGVANPAQTKIFQTTSVEDFAREELMTAIRAGQSLGTDLMRDHDLGKIEEDEEEDYEGRERERTEDRFVLLLREALHQPNPAYATARLLLPRLFEVGILKEGDFDSVEEGKFSEKNLMLLRERHVAHLIAQQVDFERQEGRSAEISYVLANLMTFFWKTSGIEALDPFYKGFFGKEDLRWDIAVLTSLSERRALRDSLNRVKEDPASFWGLPSYRQIHLLNLDLNDHIFKLPTSGMAAPGGEGTRSYSDCVESTTRGGVLHLLRNSETGDMEADLLPDGLFKEHFVRYSNETERLSKRARDDWAKQTWQVREATREKEGKLGFSPTLENVLLTLQVMMQDQEPVVQPITEETSLEELSARYQRFLGRASVWFSKHLKRSIEFALEEDEGIRLLRHKKRTVGRINVKIQRGTEGPLTVIGTMNIMPHHGEYEQDLREDNLRESETAQTESGVTTEEAPLEDIRPLVERVLEFAPGEEEVMRLVPWVTPALMNHLFSQEKDIKRIMADFRFYFPQFDFVASPDLFVTLLKAALAYGSEADVNIVLRAGSLLNLEDNKREGTLMIQRLLDSPETASKVTPGILRKMVLRVPQLLEEQAPVDPHKNYETVPSFLERMVEMGEIDTLKEVGRKVDMFFVDFNGEQARKRTDEFWTTLSRASEAFPLLREIVLTNNNYVEGWDEKEKHQLARNLSVLSQFSAPKIAITTLTPTLLEFFLPVISGRVQTIEYSSNHLNWDLSDEEKITAEEALQAKIAELKQTGRLPKHIRLKNSDGLIIPHEESTASTDLAGSDHSPAAEESAETSE